MRALSPEVAMVSHASSGTPNLTSCRSTPLRARGALVTSTTTPPAFR